MYKVTNRLTAMPPTCTNLLSHGHVAGDCCGASHRTTRTDRWLSRRTAIRLFMTLLTEYQDARRDEDVARLRRVLALRAMVAQGMS